MASSIEIVNLALTMLGESRIISIDDNVKPAREAKAVYNTILESLLGSYNWSFAKTRAALPALADAPLSQYAAKFQLPADCLRVLFVGDHYVGMDLSDYRSAPTSEFTIEGREILANMSAPLNIRYVRKITDPTMFSAPFARAFAADMAKVLAEPLTQSEQKRARADKDLKDAISNAIRANAIELPPEKFPDDEWIMARL